MGVSINPQISKLSQSAQWSSDSDRVTAQHQSFTPDWHAGLASCPPNLTPSLIFSLCFYRLERDFAVKWHSFQLETIDPGAELGTELPGFRNVHLSATHAHPRRGWKNFLKNPAGRVSLEGYLVISWGMKRPIRLKIQDEKQMVALNRSKSQEHSPDPISPPGNKRGMTRWGEFDNLNHIDELEETTQDGLETLDNSCSTDHRQYESQTLRVARNEPVTENSILFRSMSDASLVKKRVKTKGAEERQSNRQHRFSINGHFYNYKTSIFTPFYGTATNVRINSTMRTQEVIWQLLNKFKIENDPSEFALYCIHQSGERKKMGNSDLPLWERFLQGPSEDIMRVFLMDTDEQEVSMDVAQYVNLELPILQRVLRKLHEDENKEIQRVVNKYRHEHHLLTQCLNSKMTLKTETTV